MLLLKIPAIDATVVFKGLLLSVDLPFSLFNKNTEGLCGKSLVMTSEDHTSKASQHAKFHFMLDKMLIYCNYFILVCHQTSQE